MPSTAKRSLILLWPLGIEAGRRYYTNYHVSWGVKVFSGNRTYFAMRGVPIG